MLLFDRRFVTRLRFCSSLHLFFRCSLSDTRGTFAQVKIFSLFCFRFEALTLLQNKAVCYNSRVSLVHDIPFSYVLNATFDSV